MRGWVLVAVVALSVWLAAVAAGRQGGPPEVQKNGIAYAKGHTAGHGQPWKALLLYHSGGVMTTGATIKAIFWGELVEPGRQDHRHRHALRRDQQHAVPAHEHRVHAVGRRARLADA